MSLWLRFSVALGMCLGVLPAVAPRAIAQDARGRMADSTFQRLMGCGKHGPTLIRKEATREVVQALANVAVCPEGPTVLAKLWGEVGDRDTLYLRTLAGVSSVRSVGVARAIISTLGDRTRPPEVRLRALGAFLAELTGRFDSSIQLKTVKGDVVMHPSEMRSIAGDSTRVVQLGIVLGGKARPVEIDAALRTELLATIARIAADPSETPDMRMAAFAVHRRLTQ